MTGKNVTGTVKFSQKMNNFQKCMVTPTFYIIEWKWQAYSTHDKFLIMTKRYLDCVLAEPEDGCQILKALLQRFCYQKHMEDDFHVTICHIG